MPISVFSDDWATRCADVLNGNPAYRQAAATWEGALVLLMVSERDPASAWRVYLDLWHGECRLARAAIEADESHARYVLTGTVTSWQLVLTGKVAPLLAIMTGKLRVAKGSLAELIPYVNAAKELVAAAAAVEAEFPEGA
jgi:putative sterol carrier protein